MKFFLQIKTEGHLQQRSQRTGRVAALFTLVLFVLGGVWVANGIDGYVQVSEICPNGPSNPLHKEVIRQAGAWFANYHRTILACVVPLGSIISALSAILFAKKWWARYIFWAQTLKVLDKDDKRKSFDVQMESSPVEEQMWDALKSLSQQEA